MNTLLLLYIILIISSQTYVSYITFLLCMIHLILYILLLGNYYLSLMYLIIYIGSIAILFIYILMVLSIVSSYRYGYLLFLFPLLSIGLFGISIQTYGLLFNVVSLAYNIYTTLLIPIAILLFVAMIFAIRSI
jgi:hypothetical protein